MSNSTLIATLGFAPQIITRAIDNILWPNNPDHDADLNRVILVHTAKFAHPSRCAWASLRHFAAYLRDTYPTLSIELLPIQDEHGNTVDDVETVTNAEITFNTIFKRVKELKADNQRIHGLVAGGRKSMIIYTMVTAQLLFTEEDKLWHLISEKDSQEPHVLGVDSEDSSTILNIPLFYLADALPMIQQLVVNSHNPASALRYYERRATPTELRNLEYFYQVSCNEVDQKILLAVYQGKTNFDIGEMLHLSESSVSRRITKVAHKFYGRKTDKYIRTKLINDMSPYIRSLDE